MDGASYTLIYQVSLAIPHRHNYAVPMTSKQKLKQLAKLLTDEQRRLLEHAADAGCLPSDNALRKIADLELTIAAVEHALDGEER